MLQFSQWPDSELGRAEPLSTDYAYSCCLGTPVLQIVLEENIAPGGQGSGLGHAQFGSHHGLY